MGFTKLDEGIIYSSIMCEDDSVFKVFTIFMATCKSNGVSPISPVFISSITKKDIEEVMRCINILESPDSNSRSTTEDGRRIRRVDGGYYLINYKKYRDFTYSDNPEAVRKRIQRSSSGHNGTCHKVSEVSGHSASVSVSSSTSVNNNTNTNKGESGDKVEKIYSMYPSRDFNNNNRSTGKCAKDKQKIASILKRKTKEELTKIIQNYLGECESNKVYLKNFGTFLNQLPEPVDEKKEQAQQQLPHPPEGYPFIEQKTSPDSLAKIKGYNGNVDK